MMEQAEGDRARVLRYVKSVETWTGGDLKVLSLEPFEILLKS